MRFWVEAVGQHEKSLDLVRGFYGHLPSSPSQMGKLSLSPLSIESHQGRPLPVPRLACSLLRCLLLTGDLALFDGHQLGPNSAG